VADRQTRLDRAAAYSAEKAGDALLVWIDGTRVLEAYQNGYPRGRPHALTEISLLLPVLALLAEDGGKRALDTPVSAHLPEWSTAPEKADITLSELLHLTSGLQPRGVGEGEVPTFEEALAAPLVHPPGASFRFGPTAVQVLGAVLERVGGTGSMQHALFRPLDIPGGRWSAVTAGTASAPGGRGLTPRLFDGAHLTPRELGRIGRLLLNDGRWNGEPILENVDRLTEPTPASPGFGLGVWLNADLRSEEPAGPGPSFRKRVPERILLPRGQDRLIYDGAPADLFMAAGRYNQRLYVLPSRRMVVVRLGRADRTWSDVAFLARLLGGEPRREQSR
jgi:CubicO group peptidase (beta-lactamase class C family)